MKRPCNNMNIVVSTDNNYAAPMLVMLYSLFANNPDVKMTIYILYAELNIANQQRIKRYVRLYKQKVVLVHVPEQLFSNFPEMAHLSVATYFRLFVGEILPKEIEKALYLDVDIIVKQSIVPLYETDIENYMFAGVMVPDYYPIELKRRLGIPAGTETINAGVLLMNVKKIREEVKFEQLYSYIRKYQKKMVSADQDIINALYCNKIKYVDAKYNYLAIFNNVKEVLKYPVTWYQNVWKRDIVIVHYAKKSKPWNKRFGQQCLLLYQKYEYKSRAVPVSVNKNICNILFWWINAVREI